MICQHRWNVQVILTPLVNSHLFTSIIIIIVIIIVIIVIKLLILAFWSILLLLLTCHRIHRCCSPQTRCCQQCSLLHNVGLPLVRIFVIVLPFAIFFNNSLIKLHQFVKAALAYLVEFLHPLFLIALGERLQVILWVIWDVPINLVDDILDDLLTCFEPSLVGYLIGW